MEAERIQTEEIQPRPRLATLRPQFTDTPTAAQPKISSNRSVDYSAIVAVIRAISAILAVRLFLLLSVIGSFVLAFMAMAGRSAAFVLFIAFLGFFLVVRH